MLNNIHFLGATLVICVGAAHVRYTLIVREFEALNLLQEKEQALQQDLAQAYAFQKQLMRVPEFIGKVRFALSYKPMEVVGGDLVEVWETSEGRYAVMLIDVAGHGVQGCLRAMQVRNAYDSMKRENFAPVGVAVEAQRPNRRDVRKPQYLVHGLLPRFAKPRRHLASAL